MDFVASTVLPLLVAFFNLLIAGHSLSGARKNPALFTFGLGPLGVGLWATAWFLAALAQARLLELQLVGGIAGAIGLTGYAIDAWRWSTPAARRALLLLGAGAALALLATAVAVTPAGDPLRASASAARVLGLAILAVLGAALLGLRRRPDDAGRLARHLLWVVVACTIGYLAFGSAAMLDARTPVDPLLLIVLVAETSALTYILDRRVQMHIVLSRAVVYALISIAVSLGGAFLLKRLGFAVDLRLLAVTVAITFSAALLFLGFGELMSRRVLRLLFPRDAELEASLAVAREEADALRRRLDRVERLAIAGELAARIAHEIKNPLSPIRGYAQLLAAKLAQVDPAERALFEKALRIIREESDRIDHRVAELLSFAKADRPKRSAECRCELDRVLIEAIAASEGEPGVREVVRRIHPGLGPVIGDEDEIRSALVNVLKNAAEAMQPSGGGVIEVHGERRGDRAVITVADEGPGVEGDLSVWFDPFTTTKRGGTGLGLAIAKSAVETAGGAIRIENREDRRGARATIELLIGPAAEAAGRPGVETAVPKGGALG